MWDDIALEIECSQRKSARVRGEWNKGNEKQDEPMIDLE